jgi:flagellar basal-body rod protein FlgG
MIRGIYTAASGMLFNMQQVEQISNNLANINTSGFKRKEIIGEAFGDLVQGYSDTQPKDPSSGTGVHVGQLARFESPGQLRQTKSPLDLAITTEGHYLVARTPNGQDVLTRDGQLFKDQNNRLVTSLGGVVLDANRRPITITGDLKNLKIREDGTIFEGEAEIASILVVSPSQEQLQSFPNAVAPLRRAEGFSMKQGFLESSNVNVISEMVGLMTANRMFGMEQKIVSAHDQMLQKAANDLGRAQ